MKKPILIITALCLGGCNHMGAASIASSSQRLNSDFIAAFNNNIGTNPAIKLAYPHATNIHAGDVFLNPRIDNSTITLSLGNRKCNLGEELKTDIAMETPFTLGLSFNQIYNFNANLKFDLASLFNVSVGDEGKPTSIVHVRFDKLTGHSVSTAHQSNMYPEGGPCHKAVTRALRRGDKVFILKAVYVGSVFMKVGQYVNVRGGTLAPLGPVTRATGGVLSDNTIIWGSEQQGPPVLMAVEYRRITSFADIIGGN